jgi:long-chain acyl-CoA synthetase
MSKPDHEPNLESISTLADGLFYWARRTPDAPAWWMEHDGKIGSVSWKEVEQATIAFANRLLEKKKRLPLVDTDRGSSTSDNQSFPERVMSYLPNGIEWAIVDLACQILGFIHVPIDRRIPKSELDYYRSRIRPIFAFDSKEDLADEIQQCLASSHLNSFAKISTPRHSTVATILFTSGTSHRPKGVMLSHDNLVQNARAKLEAVPQLPTDRRLNILPFAHAYARTCELSTWLLSGSSMLSVSSYKQMSNVAPLYQPTLINAVPYIFEKIQQDIVASSQDRRRDRGRDRGRLRESLGNSLRILASGGAGLSVNVFSFFEELGLPIIQGYGLTEASPVICSNRVADPKANCVGLPVRDTEIFMNEEQRLFVRGPGVMLGYWDDREATAHRIRNGWLDTGDRAVQLPDGTLRILGRCDDRIVLKTGDKLDPLEIEQRLLRIASVEHLVLIGHQEKFVSAIVVTNEVHEQNLLDQFRMKLSDCPDYAIPKRLILVRNDWSMESGLLNHKGAVIRPAVMDRYRLDIGRLYHPSLGRRQESLKPRQDQQDAGSAQQDRDSIQQ